MFADGLCERWMILDKSALEDSCGHCVKKVEVLRSSEKDEAHTVTSHLGTSSSYPIVYIKDGLEDEDLVYSSSYETFWDEALDIGGANVFIRNSGTNTLTQTNSQKHTKNIFNCRRMFWELGRWRKPVLGVFGEILKQFHLSRSSMVYSSFRNYRCQFQDFNSCSAAAGGQSLDGRLPGSLLTCWDNSTSGK